MYNQYPNNGYNNNGYNNNQPRGGGGGGGIWIFVAIGIIVGYVIFAGLDWNNTNMLKWIIGIAAVIIVVMCLNGSNPGGRNNGTRY